MRKPRTGFSLVELLVTLAVAVILVTAATPSLLQFVRANRLAAASNELVAALQLARAEALRRGRPVGVCASGDQSTCNAGGDWSGGWILFQDAVVSGAPAPTATGAELVRVWQRLDGFILGSQVAWLRFLPDGSVDWPAGDSGIERHFDLRPQACVGDGDRRIHVGRLGRIRTEKRACG